MALSATVEHIIRAGGSIDNGGGFAVGASGTDFSDQDAAQESYTTLASAGTGTTLTCSGGDTFHADIVGNIIRITSGTNFTPGWYEVTARASSTEVTIDRNPTNGSAASAGVGNMGGALLCTVLQDTGFTNSTNYFPAATTKIIWFKSGTHTMTANATMAFPSTGVKNKIKFIGFDTTRGVMPEGDNRPLIAIGSFTFWINTNYPMLAGLRFTTAGTFGVRLQNDFAVRNIKIECTGSWALFCGSDGFVDSCEFIGNNSGSGMNNQRGITRKCVFKNLTLGMNNGHALSCIFDNCATGIMLGGVNGAAINCTFNDCTTGVTMSIQRTACMDNIFSGCATGISVSVNGYGQVLEPNLFHNCTNNYNSGGDVDVDFITNTYANKVGDPDFTDPVNGDFSISTTGAAWNFGVPLPDEA